MADALIGFTEVQRQDIITALVQKQLISETVLAPTVMNVTQYAVKGMKSITFPYAGNFTVNDKSENTAVDAQTLTYSGDQLSLDKHKVIQWLIEKSASMQSVVNVELDAVGRAVKGLARQLDLDIYTALAAADDASPDHRIAFANSGTDNTLGKADILEAIRLLEVQEVDSTQLFMAIHPTEKKALLAISDFIDASKFGSAQAIQKGQIGEVFGVKVLVSTAVTAGVPVVYHPDAVAWGLQIAPEYDTQKDLANLGTRYSVDQLYGTKTMQGGKLCVKLGSAT